MNAGKHLIFLLLAFSLLLTACVSKRKVITQPLKEQGPEYLFQQLKKNELHYQTLSAKFEVAAELNNDNKTFSGTVTILRDSVIWLSISKFGLEAARFLITPDSAKMINRLNSTYFIGSFDYVSKLFNVDFDFDILQSLIVGNDFSYYDNDIFKAMVDGRQYKLSTIGRRKLKKYVRNESEEQLVLIQDIWLDPLTFKIVRVSMKEVKNENRKFEASYSQFDQAEEQRFPFSLHCEITDAKRIAVDIQFTKVLINQGGALNFKIPSNYTRTTEAAPKQ